jgi:hypothetical protein
MSFWEARRVRADLSWRRALKKATDSWDEAAAGQGTCRPSTSHVSIESPMGARRKAMRAGGGSQPEERHGLAAEVHKIHRRRKKTVPRAVDLNISVLDTF